MKAFFKGILWTSLILGCTRAPELPRQEQMEKEKHEDIKHLDQEMEKEQRWREVKSQRENFSPANQ